jgi:hypothetical protein
MEVHAQGTSTPCVRAPAGRTQSSGADALQLTLRLSFRARLTASVDMTSDVKSWRETAQSGVCLLISANSRAIATTT